MDGLTPRRVGERCDASGKQAFDRRAKHDIEANEETDSLAKVGVKRHNVGVQRLGKLWLKVEIRLAIKRHNRTAAIKSQLSVEEQRRARRTTTTNSRHTNLTTKSTFNLLCWVSFLV